jgi:DNA helicase IV
MAHPELPAEQAYVDHAYDCLERIRRQIERVGEAVDAPEYQTAWFEAWARSRLATFEEADRGLCFGRLDVDGAAAPLYVGRRWVHEDDTPLVVNWQAPAARPFYTATVAEPLGVTLRRRFRVEGRSLLDLYDEPLDGSAGDVVHGVADILLEELERSRDEHMRDIVATIQSDQFRLITREPEGLFVIQGGPGTGKTAVGLHRASWLLYTYRRELERSGVLVVGPNPVFMDYISHVLPMLGEERVEQRAIDELAGIEPKRRERPDVARRKGDVAMADALARAARALPAPPDEILGIRVDGVYLYVEPGDVAALVAEAQASAASQAEGRERLRMLVARRLYEQYGRRLEDLAFRSFDELEQAIRSFLTKLVDRAWPRVKPEQLVRRVLAEQGLSARGWSDADLPLLDEARELLEGPLPQHGHVIVDEAQDLTPMQMRMLARRTSGAMTILGDIAQAAGPVGYRSWEDVLPHLADGREVSIAELRLAYRVPRQVMELALPLLPLIAPDVAAPIAYRDGDEPPRIVRVDVAEVVAAAVREAAAEAAREGRTALIAPAKLLPELPEAANSGFDELAVPFQTLTPRDAKGLEFDRVVLVEPEAIAREGGRIDGLRALYVALTRATKTLVVVHARPLPPELGCGGTHGSPTGPLLPA